MERTTITQLRSDLDGYLEKVRNGESLLVLDRGRPIACLNGMDEQSRFDDRLARLESEGLVRRAVRPFPRELIEKPPPKPGKSMLEALTGERAVGR